MLRVLFFLFYSILFHTFTFLTRKRNRKEGKRKKIIFLNPFENETGKELSLECYKIIIHLLPIVWTSDCFTITTLMRWMMMMIGGGQRNRNRFKDGSVGWLCCVVFRFVSLMEASLCWIKEEMKNLLFPYRKRKLFFLQFESFSLAEAFD